MKGREHKHPAAPTPDAPAAPAAPFFARFLEDQHGVEMSAGGPRRMTLKYPSDRDDIDPPFAAQHGNAAGVS